MVLAVFFLASCSSDEPQWADPEAHEKTVQLREQYGPLLVGTWHLERIGERQRFFERLTFEPDGTLTGLRKWQMRRLFLFFSFLSAYCCGRATARPYSATVYAELTLL